MATFSTRSTGSGLVQTISAVKIPAAAQNAFSMTCSRLAVARRRQRPLSLSVAVKAIAKPVDVSKVSPQGDRVLVRLEALPEESAGGVLLPKSAVKFDRYLVGEVISVGPEVESIESGKKVLLSDLNAYEIDLGTPEKIIVCRAGDLMATVE